MQQSYWQPILPKNDGRTFLGERRGGLNPGSPFILEIK
jgi:hypothetical protein